MNPFLLKAERKQQGWSQAQVAEALGVSARTLRRWEQGLVVPYPISIKLRVIRVASPSHRAKAGQY